MAYDIRPNFRLRGLRGKAGATTAASCGIGVLKCESAADQIARVVESRAFEKSCALGIANDRDAFQFQRDIDRFSGRVELHHVFQTRTASAFDAKSQKDVWATIFGNKPLDLEKGSSRDRNWKGLRAHYGLIL